MKYTIPELMAILMIFTSVLSCRHTDSSGDELPPEIRVKTTRIILGEIENTINLNGKTIYLKRNVVISPIAGYILKINANYGTRVRKGEVLFEIQTRENKALQNDSSIISNRGIIKITSTSEGTIDELNVNESGTYVTEGSQLCSILENKELMVEIYVPFQYNSLLHTGTACKILLSDQTTFPGSVHEILPIIDETNQTQKVLIQPQTSRRLPENLNLTVQFVNARHSHSFLVPKEALLTNETQNEYWVMRIVGKNLAVKIPVLKGIESDSLVEIISPELREKEEVILEGAYALPDSTEVKIIE